MRVLTYVDGIITVIREDDMFRGEFIKPVFMVGNFYYEPTLKQTLGRVLTPSECNQAEAYIDAFVFPKIEEYSPAMVHVVDTYGNYLGKKVRLENETEVTAPAVIGQGITWDFEKKEWYESILVSTLDGSILGSGINTSIENSTYIPLNLVDMELCFGTQKYNFETKTVDVNIDAVRKQKHKRLIGDMRERLIAITGEIAYGEIGSWERQEKEARAWLEDNTASTPFIDILLASREVAGETKADLITKIVTKAETYALWYAGFLGNIHKVQKALDAAISVDALKAVTW